MKPSRVKFAAAVATTALAAGLAAFSTFTIIDAIAGPNPSDSLIVSLAHARAAPAVHVAAGR